ncbi:MAG: IPT/TIG domain-containing protein [Candidatus Sericytochromatia bacterium]
MKPIYALPFITCLSLSVLAACQSAPLAQSSGPTPPAAITLPVQDTPQASSAASPVSPLVKIPARGEVRYNGQTLTVQLQLPPLGPDPARPFQTQLLDLNAAAKITATVSDSYGKSYTPVGADGNGQIDYPASGEITLSFNNVRPDALLLVEAQVTEASPSALIPQAYLAVALRHSALSDVTTDTLDFQSTAVAKTLKALLALDAGRARTVSLPDLNSLMQTITGRSGTAPNYTYTQKHPTQLRIGFLSSDLVTQEPLALAPLSKYRDFSATVRLTITGLQGSDRLQVQLTDAATSVKTDLGNGSGSATFNWTNATPGAGLKLKVASFGTPSAPYTFTTNPETLPTLFSGGSQNVTITAIPYLAFSDFSPAYGMPGTAVTLTGSGFDASTTVRFNGVNASITLDSSTQITAIVPATATDGPISITKGATTLTSATHFDVSRKMYVKANASGSNDGTSWAHAYTDLQTALTAAGAGDEIWIAAGTYTPHASDPNVSFVMKDHIQIYGGFVGNESTLAARDFVANPVILSGDIDGNDDMSGDYLANYSGNTRELIGYSGRSYTLDGVILQGANGTAMSMGTQGNPIIKNVIFRYNFSSFGGAAIYLSTHKGTFENLVFAHNLAKNTAFNTGRGGAIYITNTGNLNLTNAIFFKNRAEAPQSYGGAVCLPQFDSQATFTNVVFAQNSASNRGGAIDTYGNVTLRNVTLAGNTSSTLSSGGIHRVSGDLNAKNVLFWNSSFISWMLTGSEDGNITLPDESSPFIAPLNPAGADGIYFTADDGLHLNSSATDVINAGINDDATIPERDILNRARLGGAHEPGAYEYGY